MRRERYGSKPSRFESLFVCPTESGLRQFVTRHRSFDILYEVELVDPTAPRHEGDWSLFGLHEKDDYAAVREKALRYWGSSPSGNEELITTSSLRIVRRLPGA